MKHLMTLLILTGTLNVSGIHYQTDTIDINSDILKENRKIICFKPDQLTKPDSVIFIYLLDGEYAGYRFKKIQNEFPGVKIIGIGIVNTERRRDMLPLNQPDKFSDFLSGELIPDVEKNYNVKNRVIFGHSFAGGFVIHAMIQSPGLFNMYIASSPTPIMDVVDQEMYGRLDMELSTDIDFYAGYGSKDMKQVRKWTSRLKESLVKLELQHIHWKVEVHEGKNHNNADVSSLINGLNNVCL